MPRFDQMLEAVRGDADIAPWADASDLRRAGAHRAAVQRGLGAGVAVLLVAGVTAGVALVAGGTTAPRAPVGGQPGPTAPASTYAQTAVPSVAPSLDPSAGQTQSGSATLPPPPDTTPPDTQPPACTTADFTTNHVTVVPDDAIGIRGFDVAFGYLGTGGCTLDQPARMLYTDAAGQLVAFGLWNGSASGSKLEVKPHANVMFSVAVTIGNPGAPPPPECAKPITYRGLVVKINEVSLPLPGVTLTLPCSGAGTTEWSNS